MTRAPFLIFLTVFFVACAGKSEPDPTPTSEPTETPTPSPVTVRGTFTLIQDNPVALSTRTAATRYPTGTSCEGSGGYSDVREGMEVVLLDGTTTIGVARFGPGKYGTPNQFNNECVFAYELDVPPGYKFYTLKIGRRGERTYTFEEITTPGELSHSLGR